MKSKAYLLFETQAPRESRRIDSTVIRVLYAGFALSNLISITRGPFSIRLDPSQAGLSVLKAMSVVHAALAVLLAVRLAGDVAGDRASGLVGQLSLAGVSARDAVLSRLLLAGTSFLSVWLIRVPLLVLAFHLGGTSLHQILHVEALLLGLFGMTLCAGLLLGHYSPDRTTSRMIFLLPGLLDLTLTIPSLIVAGIHSWTTWNVPLSVEYALDKLAYARTTACLFYALRLREPSLVYLSPLVVHIGIALWSLWAWRRVYFTCLDEAEVPATPENEPQPVRPSKSMSRPSRPCWDDALAWQAYHVHSDGKTNILARSVVIAICLVVVLWLVLFNDPAYRGLGMALLTITTLIMMFIGRGKASDCLQREIKEKTLPSLVLTPHSATELCDGWARGGRKLMRPDLVLYVCCLVGVLLYSPQQLAPIIVGWAILIQSSGPFFVLSPLVPFSFKGILSGLGLIAAVLVILGMAVPLSVQVHPWLGPAAMIPLCWGWNRLCRWMLPSWFANKQDELA